MTMHQVHSLAAVAHVHVTHQLYIPCLLLSLMAWTGKRGAGSMDRLLRRARHSKHKFRNAIVMKLHLPHCSFSPFLHLAGKTCFTPSHTVLA